MAKMTAEQWQAVEEEVAGNQQQDRPATPPPAAKTPDGKVDWDALLQWGETGTAQEARTEVAGTPTPQPAAPPSPSDPTYQVSATTKARGAALLAREREAARQAALPASEIIGMGAGRTYRLERDESRERPTSTEKPEVAAMKAAAEGLTPFATLDRMATEEERRKLRENFERQEALKTPTGQAEEILRARRGRQHADQIVATLTERGRPAPVEFAKQLRAEAAKVDADAADVLKQYAAAEDASVRVEQLVGPAIWSELAARRTEDEGLVRRVEQFDRAGRVAESRQFLQRAEQFADYLEKKRRVERFLVANKIPIPDSVDTPEKYEDFLRNTYEARFATMTRNGRGEVVPTDTLPDNPLKTWRLNPFEEEEVARWLRFRGTTMPFVLTPRDEDRARGTVGGVFQSRYGDDSFGNIVEGLGKGLARIYGDFGGDQRAAETYLTQQAATSQPKSWQQQGQMWFGEQAQRGFRAALPDELLRTGALLASVQRLDRNGSQFYDQRDSDLSNVENYLLWQLEQQARGETTGGKVGYTAGQSAEFAIEFALTRGAYAGMSRAARGAAMKLLGSMGKKSAARMLARGAGWVAGSAARTAAIPTRVGQEYAQLRMPEVHLEGNRLVIDQMGEAPATAFFKAFGDVLVENMSEVSGARLAKYAGKVAKNVPVLQKLIPAFKKAAGESEIGRLWLDMVDRRPDLAQIGFNGVLEEMGEERLGDILRLASGLPGGQLAPSADQIVTEALSFGLMGGVGTVPGVARVAAQESVKAATARASETATDIQRFRDEQAKEYLRAAEAKGVEQELDRTRGVPFVEPNLPETQVELPREQSATRPEAVGGGPVIPTEVAERLKAELPAEPETTTEAPTLPQDASAAAPVQPSPEAAQVAPEPTSQAETAPEVVAETTVPMEQVQAETPVTAQESAQPAVAATTEQVSEQAAAETEAVNVESPVQPMAPESTVALTVDTGKIAAANAPESPAVAAEEIPAEKPKRLGVSEERAERAKVLIDEYFSGARPMGFPNIPTDLIGALVVRGAYHLENLATNGVKAFSAWKTKMIEELGPKVEPFLAKVWSQIRQEQPQLWETLVSDNGPSGTVSTKNAVMDDIRIGLGEQPVRGPTVSTAAQHEDAVAEIRAHPDSGRRLVQGFLRSVDAQETSAWDGAKESLLRAHITALTRTSTDITRQIAEAEAAGDKAAVAFLEQARSRVRSDILEASRASGLVGTMWGQLGLARQVENDLDFNIETKLAEYELNNGKPATAKLEAQLRDLAERLDKSNAELARLTAESKNATIDATIAELQKELAKERAAREALQAQMNQKAGKQRPAGQEPIWKSEGFGKKNKIVTESRKDEAEAALRAMLFRSSTFTDPVAALKNLTVWMTYYLEGGVRSLAEAQKALRERFGTMADEMAAIAPDAYRQASADLVKREIAAAKQAGKSLDKMYGLARQLEKAVVESGITEREAVVDKVHENLLDSFPELERTETVDLLSRYGKYTAPSTDAVTRRIAEINAELLLISKYDAVEATNERPKPTGQGRYKPTKEARALLKSLISLMRRRNLNARTSEDQLQSIEDARLTRMQNRIEDLRDAIAKNQPIERATNAIPYNEADQKLKDELDAAQAEYDAMFPRQPLSYEQRVARALANVEARIAKVREQLATGNVARPTVTRLTSPELDARRAELTELNRQAAELRDLQDPGARERKMAETYMKRLQKEKAGLEAALADPNYTRPAPKTPRRLSKAERDLKRKNNDLKHALWFKTRTPWERLAGHLAAISAATRFKAAGDISYIGLQTHPALFQDIGALPGYLAKKALGLQPDNPFVWYKGVRAGVKSYLNEEAYLAFEQEVADWENLDEATRAGLGLTFIGPNAKLAQRPEDYASQFFERNALLYREGARAASATNNIVMMSLYELERNAYVARGIEITPAVAKKIAADVSDTAGRMRVGDWGSQVRNAMTAASVGLWSAKNTGATIRNAVTGFHALSLDPVRRSFGIKRMVGALSVMFGTQALVRLLGGDDDDFNLNPASDQFGKLRIGNTRINVLGGEAALWKAIVQFIRGSRVDAAGDVVPSRDFQSFRTYFGNKRAPMLDLIAKLSTGRDFRDKKIDLAKDWSKEALEMFTYLWMQDAAEAAQDSMQTNGLMPSLAAGAGAGALSMGGLGVNTYDTSEKIKLRLYRKEMAQRIYHRDIDDLSYKQFKDMVKSPDRKQRELVDKFQAAKEDRDTITINKADAIAAGQDIFDQLDDRSRAIIDALRGSGGGVSLDTNRWFDIDMPGNRKEQWYMNDARFERYKLAVARLLQNDIDSLMSNPVSPLDRLTPEEQRDKLAKAIESAKERAGAAIKNLP